MKSITKDTIDRYVKQGVPTGGFLRAVLENKLKEAFMYADLENRRDMFEIVSYCYYELPGNCWGSPEAVKEWLEMFRKERKNEEKV